jgi:hypothetical protein
MAAFYNANLKPLGPNTPTHPYDHATKLFLADNYRLAPKQGFLYYVCLNIDQTAVQAYNSSTSFTDGIAAAIGSILGANAVSSQSLIEQYEAGLMAKRVDLPKFTLNTKTLNAYNRKHIVQTHISYDPITITFHDDAADVVTNFWNDYYTYYYRDSDYKSEQGDYKSDIYQRRNNDKWGYSPRNPTLNPLQPFLRSIQIFSLHNKRFTEYLIVNPMISSWRHGEHNSTGDTTTMENTMTIAYETVKYRTGTVNPVSVNGFATLHYDNVQSPISTSITNIYSDSGVLGVLDGAPKDLARPDGTGQTDIIGGVLNAYKLYKGLKNANLGALAKQTIGQIGAGIVGSAVNSAFNNVLFPTNSTAAYNNANQADLFYNGSQGTYYSPFGTPLNNSAVTIAGVAAGATRGMSNYINQGVNSTANRVYDAVANNGTIKINPITGQPVAGSSTLTFTDDQGNIISQQTSQGTQSGTYDPGNPALNLVDVQTTQDEGGNTVVVRKYRDGTQVTEDADGNILGTYPGTQNTYNPSGTNTTPANTRDQVLATGIAASGTGVQYKTDPRTGITTTVGGTVSAQVTNGISIATGSVVGLTAGSYLNSALNSTALGKTQIGRTLSAAASTAAGAYLARGVNNGLQPIVNELSKSVNQAWDSASGSIKNVMGSWTGDGKFNPFKPTDNIVSKIPDGEGGWIITDKTGQITNTDGAGKVTGIVPTRASLEPGWSEASSGSIETGKLSDRGIDGTNQPATSDGSYSWDGANSVTPDQEGFNQQASGDNGLGWGDDSSMASNEEGPSEDFA